MLSITLLIAVCALLVASADASVSAGANHAQGTSPVQRTNRQQRRVHQRDVRKDTRSNEISDQRQQSEELTVVAGGAEAFAGGGGATIPSSIFNLAKTILGAGILSLPGGVASFSDNPKALVPASLLLVVMGLVSAYSFSSIGRACSQHNAISFADAWAKSVQHEGSAKIVAAIVTFKTFFACLAYSIIIGDSFSQIFRSFNLPAALCKRPNVIIGLTSLIVLPLCSLKKLDALKYTSILGLLGTVYCAVFMGVRLRDGSYAEGGKFLSEIADEMRPSFNSRTGAFPYHMVLVLVSMISTAYVAHYNAPKFFTELKNKTMARYNTVTASAFLASMATYITVMWLGFLTFGGGSSGFVLNNYSNADPLATIARVAIGAGIICSYPLTFTAMREGTLDVLGLSNATAEERERYFMPVTMGLLSILTGFALVLRDVGAVLSFSGALIGSVVIYIIPAIMNICNIAQRATERSLEMGSGHSAWSVMSTAERVEQASNYLLAGTGVVLGVAGVAVNFVNGGSGAGH